MILQFIHVVWPIFACAGLGWLWQRLGQPFDEKSISALVAYLGVPSLLLTSLSKTEVRLDVLLETLLAGSLALALCAAAGAAALKLARLPVRPYLPSIIHPNTGNLGLPIVFFALGEPAMPYAIAFSTLVQISHFTVGVGLASGQMSWRTVLVSPPLYSLAVALALIGLSHIGDAPQILQALNPINGFWFMTSHGIVGFTVLGSVFLSVTGAEALYADMGHFGRKPKEFSYLNGAGETVNATAFSWEKMPSAHGHLSSFASLGSEQRM